MDCYCFLRPDAENLVARANDLMYSCCYSMKNDDHCSRRGKSSISTRMTRSFQIDSCRPHSLISRSTSGVCQRVSSRTSMGIRRVAWRFFGLWEKRIGGTIDGLFVACSDLPVLARTIVMRFLCLPNSESSGQPPLIKQEMVASWINSSHRK